MTEPMCASAFWQKITPDGVNDILISRCTYRGENHTEDQDTLTIIYGVDGNFITHAGISILSIINTTKNVTLHFYVITSDNTPDDFEKLHTIIKKTSHTLTVLQIKKSLFSLFPTSKVFSHAIYYRLLSPYLLAANSKILYLDADIIALRSLQDIFHNRDLKNKICAVVKEAENQKELSARVGIPQGDYFNSGVMLINVPKWIKENISEKAIQVLHDNAGEFKYFDQDALNWVLCGKVHYLEKRYNTVFMIGHRKIDFMLRPPQDTVLLHYAGANKPWQMWNQQAATEYYRYNKMLSPWKMMNMVIPETAQQVKFYYKTLWNKRKYFTSVYWYLIYQRKRLHSRKNNTHA